VSRRFQRRAAWLLLPFCGAALAIDPAGPQFDETVALRSGDEQRAFFQTFLNAKGEVQRSPIQALADSVLWANAEGKAPEVFSPWSVDAATMGDLWLGFAEAQYAVGNYALAENVLATLPEQNRKAHASRIVSLQAALSLRGVGANTAIATVAADGDATGVFNQALLAARSPGRRAEAIGKLQKLATQSAAATATRHRALLWIALLQKQGGQVREAQQTLAGIDGTSPLLHEAMLAWVALQADPEPAALAAIERHVATALPASPAAWEARDALARALLARGAISQSGETALEGFNAAFEQIERIDQQLARVSQGPLADHMGLAPLLPERNRNRLAAFGERRDNLQTLERLLNAWTPYVFSFRGRIQKDPSQFATELRDHFGGQREKLLRPDASPRDRLGLFRHDLGQLVGRPPAEGAADRLFRGLAKWELGADYPAGWSAAGDATKLQKALEQSGQLVDLINAQNPKAELADGFQPGQQLKSVAERNNAAVNEMRNLAPQLERAMRDEIVAGLKERRRLAQQWLNRFAFHAHAAFVRHDLDADEPRFAPPPELAVARAEALPPQLERIRAERKTAKSVRVNLSAVSSGLRTLSENGETRLVKADATRLQAQIAIALADAKVIAGADESVGLYQSLLKNYADLSDRAETTYQLARAQEASKRPGDALATLNSFAAAFPGDPRSREAHFRVGEMQYTNAEYALARASYEKVIAQGDSRYRDQAEFKLGWTYYKLGDYREAVNRFLVVVDRVDGGRIGDRTQKERAKDAFRAIALAFTNLEGAAEAERFLTRVGRKQYLPDIQVSVASLYLENDRVQDAANSYATLVRQYPTHPRGPDLLGGIVRAAERTGLGRLAIQQKEEFVGRYAAGTTFWNQTDADTRDRIGTDLNPFLKDLAALYHADAQQQKNTASRTRAIGYYTQLIDGFPKDKELPRTTFMRGEARFEAGEFNGALADYDRSAFEFGPHDKAAEASYAALVTSEKLIALGKTSEERRALLKNLVARSSRFSSTFAGDARVDAVLVKAGEDVLMLGEPAEAATLADNLLARNPSADIRRRAQIMLAHGLFETNVFDRAEGAYKNAIAAGGHPPELDRTLRDRLGLSIYRQGEAQRAKGEMALAAASFLRVASASPQSEIVPNAEIDGAAALLEGKRWNEAITVLERFSRDRPAHRLAATIPQRLAFAYENTGRLADAADMNEVLSKGGSDPALAAQQLQRAAELREKAGRMDLATATYERFVARFPDPVEPAVETRQKLADLATRAGDLPTRDRWLTDIIGANTRAGVSASVRVRFLAAKAHLSFGESRSADFDKIGLRLPLDKSLAEKRRAMEQAIGWFDGAAKFQILEVTTAATYRTAELYRRLARDVMDSERPSGLKPLELEQYKILLEEEALPFEDKSTKLHELNIERMATGYWDDWVRRSMASLRILSPGRYERVEATGPYFIYEIPKPVEAPLPAPPGAPGAKPAPAGAGGAPSTSTTPAGTAVPAGAPAKPTKPGQAVEKKNVKPGG
jgi:cellulose synthase operon protein C